MMNTNDLEIRAQELDATGDFRVLRRFKPVASYATPSPEIEAKLRTIAVVDTETTGVDKRSDKIIEIGYVKARFLPETGQIFDITTRYSGLQDPKVPLSKEITQITGITDADVAGQAFDREKIISDLSSANVLCAHNAQFDRGFLEGEFPELQKSWWICSNSEGPWQAMRTGSTKLEFLSSIISNIFYDAHRALVDAEVLLHLLTRPAHDGRPILSHIAERSREPSYCIWATGASFEKKDVLKLERKYRWNDGSDPSMPIKAWYKDGLVGQAMLQQELAALRDLVYSGQGTVTVDVTTGRERFSSRVQSRDQVNLSTLDNPFGPTQS